MELWDLYDVHRTKLNKTHIRGSRLPKDTYHIVIHACLFNSKDEMLIQQRSANKGGWANLWDLTVGGSALSGETSQMAVQRELVEELGIHVDFEALRPAFSINFSEGFDDIYLVRKDVDLKDIQLQEEEVQDIRWASKEEILKMIEDKTFVEYKASLIELIFDALNNDKIGCLK